MKRCCSLKTVKIVKRGQNNKELYNEIIIHIKTKCQRITQFEHSCKISD